MNIVITVAQPGVCMERLYKTTSFDTLPTVKELVAIGANIVPARGDAVTMDVVSDALYNALHQAQWIRP